MERSRDLPKVSSFHQCPDFFDVFLPDVNSHQLSIPEDFINHFEGRIPKKTILKDLSGNVWHVDLEQKGKRLVSRGCKKEEASYSKNKILPFVKEEVESEPELPPICKEKYSRNLPLNQRKLTGSKHIRPVKPRIASKLVRKHQHVETEWGVSPQHLRFYTSIKD